MLVALGYLHESPESANSRQNLGTVRAAHDWFDALNELVIGEGGPTTVLMGASTLEQLDHAIAAVEKGPLPAAVMSRLPAIWSAMAGRAT